MLDVKATLDACYKVLSREFDIEEVDSIPNLKNHSHVRIWKIQITALVVGKAEDVEAYIRFSRDFPYSMPCVILPDDRFKYLPHISVGTRKLCLYEDGVVYDADNIEGIIRDNIEKTRKWIEHYYGRDNTVEYVQEIRNYWNEEYEDEAVVSDYWTLVGKIPVSTCEMIGLAYVKRNYKDGEVKAMFLVSSDESNPTIAYFKDNHQTIELPVIFLASLIIPNTPPYCMTGQQLIDSITEAADREFFKGFINSHGSGYVLFSIGLDYALGGVHIHGLKVNRNGYRKGVLKPFTLLTQFDNKKKKLDRLHLSVYNDRRMAERTAGGMMKKRSFLIAGLGSIGSNLCYYLNGYNNAEFTLADRDWLSVDNIGRHLLGFESLGQHKAHAVANYLQQYRPDRNVVPYCKYLQQLETEKINEISAIFVCTGDVMSEKWLIDMMDEGNIDKPAFLLWLEPYGISGIMIYLNPDDKDSIKRLKGKVADSFLDYCLIKREEYCDREKLTRRDVGCNGSYALYSANDVTMFLSAVFPIIDQLLDLPSKSCCHRWVGNIDIATTKNIELVSSSGLLKGKVQSLPV